MSKLFPKAEVPQPIFGLERNVAPVKEEEDIKSYPVNQYLTGFTPQETQEIKEQCRN
jgi:hypothetical protein